MIESNRFFVVIYAHEVDAEKRWAFQVFEKRGHPYKLIGSRGGHTSRTGVQEFIESCLDDALFCEWKRQQVKR